MFAATKKINSVDQIDLSNLNTNILIIVYSPTCPHCVNFDSEYTKLINTNPSLPSFLTIYSIEHSLYSKSIENNKNVSGYPAVLYVPWILRITKNLNLSYIEPDIKQIFDLYVYTVKNNNINKE